MTSRLALPEPKRNPTSCVQCHARHIACLVGIGPDTCVRCAKLNLRCEARKASFVSRENNDAIEIKAQLRRLDEVIEDLQRQDVRPSGNSDDLVDQTDLVNRLTQLCFSNDAISSDQPLVTDVARVLQTTVIKELPPSGFTPIVGETLETVENLVAGLPPVEVLTLCFDEYAELWFSRLDCLFTPVWADHIQQHYISNFVSITASELAELYGLLGFIHSGLTCLRARDRDACRQNKQLAVQYFEASQRALDLCDYESRPTIQALRALHLKSLAYLAVWIDTTRLRDGVTLIPVTLSLVHALGLNREETCAAAPTACERYERRAIATAVARSSACFEATYGRTTSVALDSFDVQPPAYLEDADLPEHLHNHPWRPSATDVYSLRVRWTLARIEFDIQRYSRKTRNKLDYKDFASLNERLMTTERELILNPDWSVRVDENSGRPIVVVPLANLPLDMQFARLNVVPRFWKLHVMLNIGFVGLEPRETTSALEVDYARHRQELIVQGKKLFCLVADMLVLTGPFVSISCSIWLAPISAATTLLLHPDDEALKGTGGLFQAWIRRLRMPNVDQATAKSARVVSYLMNRGLALTSTAPASAGGSAKRARGVKNASTVAFRGPMSVPPMGGPPSGPPGGPPTAGPPGASLPMGGPPVNGARPGGPPQLGFTEVDALAAFEVAKGEFAYPLDLSVPPLAKDDAVEEELMHKTRRSSTQSTVSTLSEADEVALMGVRDTLSLLQTLASMPSSEE